MVSDFFQILNELFIDDGLGAATSAMAIKFSRDKMLRHLYGLAFCKIQIGFDAITATNGAVISLPKELLEVGIPCESGEKILSAILQ